MSEWACLTKEALEGLYSQSWSERERLVSELFVLARSAFVNGEDVADERRRFALGFDTWLAEQLGREPVTAADGGGDE